MTSKMVEKKASKESNKCEDFMKSLHYILRKGKWIDNRTKDYNNYFGTEDFLFFNSSDRPT